MSSYQKAVTVFRRMTEPESAEFHRRVCGKRVRAWHKPKSFNETQWKFGVGVPIRVGSNAKKRARRARLNAPCTCECDLKRKAKNCCH